MSYLLFQLTSSLVRLLQFLLFGRAIFSWFPQMRGSKIAEFLYLVTEPIIMPFRSLVNRFQGARMLPIDIAFFCAFLALEFLQMLLFSLY